MGGNISRGSALGPLRHIFSDVKRLIQLGLGFTTLVVTAEA